jgi:putative iron-regulated protein
MIRILPAMLLAIVCYATAAVAAPTPREILDTYANIAEAMYGDAHSTAKTLRSAVNRLLARPSPETLAAARDAWKAARVPYQQTEGFRFGNKIVDEWQGKVNSWPLDEGLIDYVDASYGESSDENPLFRANIIANKSVRVGGETIDARRIAAKLLRRLHEAGKVEANVTTGYHAIEFLLWGQDLNGSGQPGAGNRPATDYDRKKCTHGNCERRAAYLRVVTDLLVEDLSEMVVAWKRGGKARKALMVDENAGLATILTGIGSLSYGELAGERMKLGLILHDPEEEHDCFSDNTHNSHYYNQIGMIAIYQGRYRGTEGKIVEGASISGLAAEKEAAADVAVRAQMDKTLTAVAKIKDAADSGRMAYDQMLADGNTEGASMIEAGITELVAQTRAVERVVAALGLKITLEGSNSLDDPSKVNTKAK